MKWRNQYIDLIASRPDYIYDCRNAEDAEKIALKLSNRSSDYANIFCEPCSGSGGHLIELARNNPDALCVGIELRFKRSYRTVVKAERDGIQNLIVIRGNADFLPALFAPHSLERVYVNFPDPWAKKRWQKNRILNPEFLGQIPSLLVPGGCFFYKTDHREYFFDTLDLLRSIPDFDDIAVVEDLHHNGVSDPGLLSEFEKLFISKGLPIYALTAHSARALNAAPV